MPTLLLSRSCQPEATRLAGIAHAARWHHQWISRRKVPAKLHGDDLALYAETDVALRVARRHGLVLIEPPFDFLSHLPQQYTRREVRYMTLGAALQWPDRTFVKPADCTRKVFDAGIWDAGRYIRCPDDLSRDTPVLVSEPVIWEDEFRVIVLEREVVTLSPYIRGGWLAKDGDGQWRCRDDETNDLLAFCQTLLADPAALLPPAFTLDVGTIKDRGWAVVEANPVWCSGLLGCDLAKLLPVLHRACWKRSQLTSADAVWVIDR